MRRKRLIVQRRRWLREQIVPPPAATAVFPQCDGSGGERQRPHLQGRPRPSDGARDSSAVKLRHILLSRQGHDREHEPPMASFVFKRRIHSDRKRNNLLNNYGLLLGGASIYSLQQMMLLKKKMPAAVFFCPTTTNGRSISRGIQACAV